MAGLLALIRSARNDRSSRGTGTGKRWSGELESSAKKKQEREAVVPLISFPSLLV